MEELQKIPHWNSTHGLTGTTEHNSWRGIFQRCCNVNDKAYPQYGGRGITICKRWYYFENFLKDMGNKPNKSYSIERINNNLGYYKENCKWATRKEQSLNKRRSY